MKILHFCWTTFRNKITYIEKKWPSRLRVNPSLFVSCRWLPLWPLLVWVPPQRALPVAWGHPHLLLHHRSALPANEKSWKRNVIVTAALLLPSVVAVHCDRTQMVLLHRRAPVAPPCQVPLVVPVAAAVGAACRWPAPSQKTCCGSTELSPCHRYCVISLRETGKAGTSPTMLSVMLRIP